MLPFVPYPKIAESVADWPDDDAAIRARGRLTWAATEKIHGANLCLCGDGEHVAVAKRRRLLAPDEGFFDHRAAVGGLYAAVGELVAKLRARIPLASLQIHGELFGGAYPHHEIPDGVQAVQTGIAYSPDLRFLAFDLAVVDDRGRAAFLPFAEAVELLEAAGVATVPLLATGPLHELLALPPDFESRVPAMLGLPPLPDNRAEGLVIRPWDAELEGSRPMVKRKRAAFSDARYHAAEAWASPHPSDALDAVERLGLELLDDERLASAISKVGPSDGRPERTRELIAELTADLRRDVERLAGAALLSLSAEDRALLWSVLADACEHHVERGPLDPARYFVELAHAFIRGKLGQEGSAGELVTRAREAELSLHKFKRKDGPPRVQDVLSRLAGIAPETLLDIGSGRGAFLWPLLDRFPRLPVTAIDRLDHRVADIDAVHRGGIARLSGLQADVAALPFADRAFDVVTILEVLEHLVDPLPAAREVMRVARRFVIASVPSQEDDNPEHLRLFTRDSLTALLVEAGAEAVQIGYVLGHMVAVARPSSSS